MAKVNMKEFAIFLNHHITWMPVTDSEDIGGHQIRSTWSKIILFSNAQVLDIFWVVGFKEEQSCFFVESINQSFGIIFMNFRIVLSIY